MANLIHLPRDIQSLAGLNRGFAVTHSLSDLDLLGRSGVLDLADRLPDGSAEPGLVGVLAEGGLDYEAAPMTDAGPAVRELEGKNASLYLYNVERDVQYGNLIQDVLADVRQQLDMSETDIIRHEGYVFLTGGPATTSAHVDHEYNFLLVVRGHKRVFIADVPSPEGERALEALHSGGYGACDAVPRHGTVFEIGPGEGVFIPPRGAHYVENGQDPCTALSVVFGTTGLDTEAKVYRMNAALRRLGLNPTPPGQHAGRDRAKEVCADLVLRIRGAMRKGYQSVQGAGIGSPGRSD